MKRTVTWPLGPGYYRKERKGRKVTIKPSALIPDWRISELVEGKDMIHPFVDKVSPEARKGVISFGLSSYGYDIRIDSEFRVFTANAFNTVVDPKNFDERGLVRVVANDGYIFIPPHSYVLGSSMEYMQIPNNVMCIVMGKSTYARCFSGETRVALVDGTSPTFEELVERTNKGERVWGYGVDVNSGEYRTTELVKPHYVDRESVIQVELDNGEVVNCTPDHEFLRHNLKYTEASKLKVGDGIVPLYRGVFRGRESVWVPQLGNWLPTHWLSDTWNIFHGVYSDTENTHRHHADGNKVNNNPTNIIRLDASEHIRTHNKEYYGAQFNSQEHSRSIKEGIKHLLGTPAYADSQRRKSLEFWNSPKYEKSRIERSEKLKRSWTPERRLAASKRMQKVNESLGRNHKVLGVKELKEKREVFCLSSRDTGNFALESGVIVKNCGIIVNVTPLEPGWSGNITVEISNATSLPAKIYAGQGIAQVLFFECEEVPERPYSQKGGKYQGQTEVTLPRV